RWQSIEGLIGTEMPRQLQAIETAAEIVAVEEEERRLRPTGLDAQEGNAQIGVVLEQNVGQRLYICRCEDGGDGNLTAQHLLEAVHHSDRLERVAPQVEEAVLHADRVHSENFLPDL